jgi:hypothetical protein
MSQRRGSAENSHSRKRGLAAGVDPELLFMIALPGELLGWKADDQVPC